MKKVTISLFSEDPYVSTEAPTTEPLTSEAPELTTAAILPRINATSLSEANATKLPEVAENATANDKLDIYTTVPPTTRATSKTAGVGDAGGPIDGLNRKKRQADQIIESTTLAYLRNHSETTVLYGNFTDGNYSDGNFTEEAEFLDVMTTEPPPPPIPTCSVNGTCRSCAKDVAVDLGNDSKFQYDFFFSLESSSIRKELLLLPIIYFIYLFLFFSLCTTCLSWGRIRVYITF